MTPNPTPSYDPDYFEPLANAEDRHFWFKSRNQLIRIFLIRLQDRITKTDQILEAGCGTGNVLRSIMGVFPTGSVIGMDLYHQGLVYAKSRVSCPLLQGDMHNPPFGTQFALVGLFDVMEHLEDDNLVLRDLNRMISDEGYLLLTVPAFSSLWSYFDVAGHHVRRYQKTDLNRKLELAGFRVIHLSYFMGILFPVVWLRRKISKKHLSINQNQGQIFQSTVDELRIIPVLNDILGWILSWENQLIKIGIPLPFGTSLIAVAQKINSL